MKSGKSLQVAHYNYYYYYCTSNTMGVRGFMKVINDNKEAVCTERQIKGELIIDGYALHHELYNIHNLDWANEGHYASQCQVTLDYFHFLKNSGIKPLVIVDGGGGDTELFTEVLECRKKDYF